MICTTNACYIVLDCKKCKCEAVVHPDMVVCPKCKKDTSICDSLKDAIEKWNGMNMEE